MLLFGVLETVQTRIVLVSQDQPQQSDPPVFPVFPSTSPQTHSLHTLHLAVQKFHAMGIFCIFRRWGTEIAQSQKALAEICFIGVYQSSVEFLEGSKVTTASQEHVASNVIKVQIKPFSLITQTMEKLAHDQISKSHPNNCSSFLLMLNVFFAEILTEFSLVSLSFLTNIY